MRDINIDYPLCYAQRMLNPFHGVMHIVKLYWSEAVTTDGINWTLYIRGERFYDDLHSPEQAAAMQITVPDIKYGTWSEQQGLKRSPVRLPTLYDEIELEGQTLLQTLISKLSQLPFEFQDCQELWLIDENSGKPLALLASRCDHDIDEDLPPLIWNAGIKAREYASEISHLQQLINQMAGKKPQARWFDQNADETPSALLNADLLTDNEALSSLHEWLSPYLLLLKQNREQRSQLEQQACRHAERMIGQVNLYPEIIHEQLFKAARVEIRMRSALAQGKGHKLKTTNDRGIAPFYLELND